ncbi:hypothetical protein GCM10009107_43510 [Ideonella azotifigens]|uniref:Uncharacterized protein n=1 Tax=Ideonella azotifigens TaxID=513160 RepID=A0ABP3VJK6_9BURK
MLAPIRHKLAALRKRCRNGHGTCMRNAHKRCNDASPIQVHQAGEPGHAVPHGTAVLPFSQSALLPAPRCAHAAPWATLNTAHRILPALALPAASERRAGPAPSPFAAIAWPERRALATSA